MNPVSDLLAKWEEAYKKGLLSFWMLLLLHQRACYAYEMGAAITNLSEGTISVDDNSIYRALTRFEQLGIVKGALQESEIGPKRKYYSLTETGVALLARFIERNILVFQVPAVEAQIQAVLNQNHPVMTHAKTG